MHSLLIKSIKNLIRKKSNQYITGSEPILINKIMSPLRFDIEIRCSFFEFIEENESLISEDFSTFLQKSLDHSYFIWFKWVHIKQWRPNLLKNSEILIDLFYKRVKRSIDLFYNYKNDGFNMNCPIKLKYCPNVFFSSSGKMTHQSFFAGDGCHRLALLINSGESILLPEFYQYEEKQNNYYPIDNTAFLLPHLHMDLETYYTFISKGYSNFIYTNRKSLLADVQQNNLNYFQELISVLDKDEQWISEVN